MRRVLALLLCAFAAAAGELRSAESAVVRVLKRARPAVVTVYTPFEKDMDLTGVVISGSGVILTVRKPFLKDRTTLPRHVSVRFPGEKATVQAEVIDDDETTNTLLLKAKAARGKAIRTSRAEDVHLGMWALLVGNTFGAGRESTPSASLGVVSGIVRDAQGVRAIHCSALVNPGSVGAPVIDLAGNLVGIAAPAVTRAGGQTVIVPIEHVRSRYLDKNGPGARELAALPVPRKLRANIADSFGLVIRAAAEAGGRALVGVRAGRIPADDKKPEPPPKDASKKKKPRWPRPPAPVPGEFAAHDRSSGVVFSPDGLVVCPLRVTGWPGPERPLTVDLSDGRSLKARIVGRDERLRIAVLAVDATGLAVLPHATEESLRAGRFAIALGHPHEHPRVATPQVTVGILSRTNALTRLHFAIEALQTDAGVAGGNRGGPLVDIDGRLMGVLLDVNDTEPTGYHGKLRARYAGNAGLGFAVPVHVLERLVPRLAGGVTLKSAYLGIGVDRAEDGVRVTSVAEKNSRGEKSAAKAADIRKGDILVSVAGRPLVRPEDLRAAISRHTAGETVEVVILRAGKRLTVTPTLTER